jgi:hypothetical protein
MRTAIAKTNRRGPPLIRPAAIDRAWNARAIKTMVGAVHRGLNPD